MKWKTSHSCFKNSYVHIFVKYMYSKFLKIVSNTQKTGKVCLCMYLLENNQVQQFLKFMVLSTLHAHVRDLWRPELKNTGYILLRKIKIILKEELFCPYTQQNQPFQIPTCV